MGIRAWKVPKDIASSVSLHIKATLMEELKQPARKLLKHKDIDTKLYFSLSQWAGFTYTTL